MVNHNNGVEVSAWNQVGYYVVATIRELKQETDDIQKDIRTLDGNIRVLQTEMRLKAGVWGFLAGAVPICITIAVWVLIEKLGA